MELRDPSGSAGELRRRWMSVLAKARSEELEAAWVGIADKPDFQWLRKPETGLVMVRGRAGGDGVKFNLGEVSVTRCALRCAGGRIGMAYVQGRSARHAELAALCDALLQDAQRAGEIEARVIRPLEQAWQARRAERSRKAAATRVEFFTLVRGEDEQ